MLISAGALALGVEQTRLARASLTWPAVDGEVVRSSIEQERSTGGSGPGSRSITHRPVIVYRYAVEGIPYEGRRVSYGDTASSAVEDARKVTAKYPSAGRVRVYYRPGTPAEAVLEPGSHGVPWLLTAIGGVFLAVGAILAWAAPKLIAPAPRRDTR
jgi:hypothetical protein